MKVEFLKYAVGDICSQGDVKQIMMLCALTSS